MDKRLMVVTGEPVRVTRNGRRYFSKAHQKAIVAKCLVPGASLAAVALANGFNANLVRRWVRECQAGNALVRTAARLLPVTIQAEQTRVPSERVGSKRSTVRARRCDCGSMSLRVGSIDLVLHGTVDREQLSLVLETVLHAR